MKCLAIDDEPLALAQLSDYISRVPFLSLVKPCQDAFEAMKVLSDEDVDLIFVDINMPDLNGLDFIRSLISPPLVIFTTAYSEYAVDGFKLDAVDYLLKPFEFQDLLKAADKARKQFEYKLLEQQSELGNASQVKGDSLFVKSDCRGKKVPGHNKISLWVPESLLLRSSVDRCADFERKSGVLFCDVQSVWENKGCSRWE